MIIENAKWRIWNSWVWFLSEQDHVVSAGYRGCPQHLPYAFSYTSEAYQASEVLLYYVHAAQARNGISFISKWLMARRGSSVHR